MSVVVEKDNGGKGRFESEVKECLSALLKHQQRGLGVGTECTKVCICRRRMGANEVKKWVYSKMDAVGTRGRLYKVGELC